MLDTLIQDTAPRPDAAVIWLHGLGADGQDFLPIVPQLGLPAGAGIRFVFPHAPLLPVTLNGGHVMRAWYDIVTPDLGQAVDLAGIRRSVTLLDELIEIQTGDGIAPQRILLAGFSQGGVIALHAGLRAQSRIGGVLALSAYLPLAPGLQPPETGFAVFQAHGEEDEVVPLAEAQRAREWLVQAGCDLTWRQYPMGHTVCAEEIAAIGAWLSWRLGPFERP